MFLGGVVLIDSEQKHKNIIPKNKVFSRSAVVLPDEGEEPGPLVLPDSGGAGAGHNHPVTVPVTAEAVQQVPGTRVIDRAELVTVLTTDVASLAIRGPRPTRHHVTSAILTVI